MTRKFVWHRLDECSICVVRAGGDANLARDRIAFIGTPFLKKEIRVRIRASSKNLDWHESQDFYESLNWAHIPEEKSDEESREWCEAMLSLLGHEEQICSRPQKSCPSCGVVHHNDFDYCGGPSLCFDIAGMEGIQY